MIGFNLNLIFRIETTYCELYGQSCWICKVFYTDYSASQPGASFKLFLGGQNPLLFLNATGLLKNWKKTALYMRNLTLFIVPFFLFSLFFSFLSLISFFLYFLFFLFFISLGGRRPPSPQMTPLVSAHNFTSGESNIM